MVTALSPATKKHGTQAPSDSHAHSDVLILDAQTLKDLEIFESGKEGASIFELCNHTRNEKGAKALRKRMERPWSTPERIRAVQESLAFILEHRQAFDRLPTFATTEIVERYFRGALPLVMSENALEFWFGMIELRYGDSNRFYLIVHGVKATSALIRALRKIVHTLEPTSPSGEIAMLLEEMRTLLARSGFSQVAEQEPESQSAWKVLRCDQTFRVYEKQHIDRLLQLVYEIDALLSMADTNRKHGFTLPQIETGPLRVQGTDVVHPLVPNMIANSVDIDQERRLLFLTGPNMAGKTTYLRACAIALFLAHMGMGVPARSFSFVPVQRLFSSITLADNLHDGVSFFHAEALRIKELAQILADGYRVFALMDEPFKGTNVKDAYDASSAILSRFATKDGSLFMFSSHLIELCDQMSAIDQIDCRCFEAGEQNGRLHFEYILRAGVSSQRLGMRVLEEQGIFELLDGKNPSSP